MTHAVAIGGVAAAIAMMAAGPAQGRTVPFADTEDATLSEIEVDEGWLHPIVALDLRNGDYARGAYDDDDANLSRVPLHLAFGFAAELRADASGDGDLFLIGQSSNGLHGPRREETARPRAWYESNNLLGLAWRPAGGVSAAATYAIKTSPNGISATTHEASLTFALSGDTGLARLEPIFAVTMRPHGGAGVYTIVGLSPGGRIGDGEDAPMLSVPLTVGVGWGGFYDAGSGNRVYASGGLSLSRPVAISGARGSLSLEMLLLVRDDRLRRLDAPGGTTATVVPLGTLTFRVAL